MKTAGGSSAGSPIPAGWAASCVRWFDRWLTLIGSSCCMSRAATAQRACVERYERGESRPRLHLVGGRDDGHGSDRRTSAEP